MSRNGGWRKYWGVGTVETERQHNGRISGSVWRAVNQELHLYPLRKSRLLDARQAIYDQYTAISWPDDDRVQGGGADTKIDKMVYRLTGNDIVAQESWIRAIEEVIHAMNNRQRRFYELHYVEGRGIINCVTTMSFSDSSVTRLKREIVYMAAVRLGYLK